MGVLGYLTLCVGAFALFSVVVVFILMMIDTVLDEIDEKRQAKERGRKR